MASCCMVNVGQLIVVRIPGCLKLVSYCPLKKVHFCSGDERNRDRFRCFFADIDKAEIHRAEDICHYTPNLGESTYSE